jgi:hypothetical protein
MYYKVTLHGPQHDNCPSKSWGMNNHNTYTHTLLARKPTSYKIDWSGSTHQSMRVLSLLIIKNQAWEFTQTIFFPPTLSIFLLPQFDFVLETIAKLYVAITCFSLLLLWHLLLHEQMLVLTHLNFNVRCIIVRCRTC